MLIHSLMPASLLSFGTEAEPIALRPLNVVIGPNGSGKSNLIEAVGLLQAAPRELAAPVSEGGGVQAWLFQGMKGTASLEAVIEYPGGAVPLRYRLAFTERGQRFALAEERLEEARPRPGNDETTTYFGRDDGHLVIDVQGEQRRLRPEDVHPELSILAQRKDPDQYPELTWLGEAFRQIRIYREWSFGRRSVVRTAQRTDLPNDFLAEDTHNLGLVLNRLRRDPEVKEKLLAQLRVLYDGIEDFDVSVEGGTVQVFLQEGRFTVPATRLSDGTLRYLCLLTVLCHPKPPPLLVIEEPELGLHPDVLPSLVRLLVEASERAQLIVTTHSDILVDALTETPEAVLVCEKQGESTVMRRLDREELDEWLEKYSLGELWTRGDLGGTRW